MRANLNVKKTAHTQKVVPSVPVAANFHAGKNVNRLPFVAPAQPSYILPAKLHTGTTKDDQFEKNFGKKDDLNKDKLNNINQTNFQGKKASEPPSGHSYAFSASGPVGTRGEASVGGSPSSSASSTGFGGASTGKQSGSETKWPPSTTGSLGAETKWNPKSDQTTIPSQFRDTEETPSTAGEPWAQSGHSTGTQWAPKTNANKNKEEQKASNKMKDESANAQTDVFAKNRTSEEKKEADPLQSSSTDTKTESKTDAANSSFGKNAFSKGEFEKDKMSADKRSNDPLKQTFTSTAFPEVTSKTTAASNDKSGIESQYDKRQFNNSFDNLKKNAPETADSVLSSAKKAMDTINRTGAGEGMFTGVTNQSKDEMDKMKDKGYTHPDTEFSKKAETGDNTFKTYDTKKEKEFGIRTTGDKDINASGKMEGKEYENQVKGLDHKDQTFYANTLGDKGKANVKGDPYLKTSDPSKDYEHKVKGTHYSEIEEPKVQTVSKDAYEARNNDRNNDRNESRNNNNNQTNESNKSTYEYMADKAKDIFHDVAEKAKDTYNNMSNTSSTTKNNMEATAKNTFNNAEATTKNAINNVATTAKNTYNAFESKAKDVIDDIAAGQRSVTDNQTGEKRFATGDDVKQDSSLGSMASTIVSKVKDAAENVKEKVGNILHSVTSENNNMAKDSKFESGYESNKPYATEATSDRDVNMNNKSGSNEKTVQNKQNVAHPRHHPDSDNIGHASG